uniref:hypothetical protein n=1 Tax=uncultured Allobacillus sp. TaxID=1638025 RepID=UPI0025935B1B|nr:hypothetical protein [uncultured Allobacillus sp.]
MKKFTVLICMIIFMGLIVGCSANTESFDDKDIIFEVSNTKSNDDIQFNNIKIINKSGFNLDNLSLKISYPLDALKSTNGIGEKQTFEFMEEFKIKSNETKEFPIPLAFKKDIETSDLEIDFEGEVVEGNKKVPFEIGGSLSVLSAKP